MTSSSTSSSSLSPPPEIDDDNAIIVAERLGIDMSDDVDAGNVNVATDFNGMDEDLDPSTTAPASHCAVSRDSSSDLSPPPPDLPNDWEEFCRQKEERERAQAEERAEGQTQYSTTEQVGTVPKLAREPTEESAKGGSEETPEEPDVQRVLEPPKVVPKDVGEPTDEPTEPAKPPADAEDIGRDEALEKPADEPDEPAEPASRLTDSAYANEEPATIPTGQPHHTETLAEPSEATLSAGLLEASTQETEASAAESQEEHTPQSVMDADMQDAEQPAQAPIEPSVTVANNKQTEDKTENPQKKTAESQGSLQTIDHAGAELRTSSFRDDIQYSVASSLAAMADQSELSSVPSLVSSKATTPADVDISPDASGPSVPPSSSQQPTPTTPKVAAPAVVAFKDQSITAEAPLLTIQTQPLSSQPSSPLPNLSASLMPGSTQPKRVVHKVKPKSSIPTDKPFREYARQCIAAAESSRLNPYGLHEEEHAMLRQHISPKQVTTYLNLRNGILRLWMLSPMNVVKRNDAIGCAKDSRWFDVASVCFDWLVRRGYINYGCTKMEKRKPPGQGTQSTGAAEGEKGKNCEKTTSGTSNADHGESPTKLPKRRRRIIVIGAGMAGLGCARQLEGLFAQYADRFGSDEDIPEVVVLEGRNRIGGRVYSRAFEVQPGTEQASLTGRATAEMGGMIITGFDRGNPMNVLLRGQLGLKYHLLLSETTIYDIDGKPVDIGRDGLVENLFNECLDRVSEYKFKLPQPKVVEGNHDLVNEGRDSSSEGHRTLAQVEDAKAAETAQKARDRAAATLAALAAGTPVKSTAAAQSPVPSPKPPDLVPVSSDRLTGRSRMEPGTLASMNAACKVKAMGWNLKPDVADSRDLDLDPPARTEGATLGYVVEEAIKQYRDLIDLNAQDLRLLNWHIANLEYSNAINQNCLSLKGWDIDAGNEWEGRHSMVIGGYQSVPRGLMAVPTPLNIHRNMAVKKITSLDDMESSGNMHEDNSQAYPMKVESQDGHTFYADFVVNTIPLGVLKENTVEFDPPLPSWKAGVIQRLGYGVLNKIVLSFKKPFWDRERDIFGVLRAPANRLSLNQKEYSEQRGRMFQWFNVSKSAGIPCLLALMAGDAAYDTEKSTDDELVEESLSVLRSVFGTENVGQPVETIITRWASDKFARGSYSSAGPEMLIDDYDTMARRVGRQIFAGEHTIGTHPATVHGAYLSGLRAASEIIEELLGPIHVPTPLIIPKDVDTPSLKRKAPLDDGTGTGGEDSSSSFGGVGSGGTGYSHREAKANFRRRLEAREQQILEYIESVIGRQPVAPPKVVDNSYLLFSKVNYDRARKKCEEGRRPGKGKPLPNDVRVLTSKMWRSAGPDERRPFVEQALRQKQEYVAAEQEYKVKAAEWDAKASELRAAYEKEHPPPTPPSNSNSNYNSSGTNGNGFSRKQPLTPGSETAAAVTTSGSRGSPGGRKLRRLASNRASAESDMYMTG